MIEEWRDVVGWEGLYMISSHGRVLSLPRTTVDKTGKTRRWPGRMIKPSPNYKSGYLTFALHRDGERGKRISVQRAMLAAFVCPRPPGREACHRNDIPSDNRLENLYWGTHSDNMRDVVRNGNHEKANKTHCPQGHEYAPENTVMSTNGKGRPGRVCKTCKRAVGRAYMARKRAEAKESAA